MSKEALIDLQDVYVDGVNMLARANGLKQFMLSHKKLGASVRVPIMRGVTFQAKPGERIGIVGRNGSGKSSILKTIAGIYPPKAGRVTTHGKIVPLIEMGLGFEPELSGRDNIKLGLLYTGRLDAYSKAMEEEIINFAELGEKIDVPYKYYSSGMAARLAFSVSIYQHPDILLLDEVFAVGDASFIEKSKAAMVNKITSVPIALFVSHSAALLREVCNRFVWMRDGKIIADSHDVAVLDDYEREAA